MITAVMVGGPLHGRTQKMPEPPPTQWLVPRPTEISLLDLGVDTITTPEPYRYELRWYRGRRPWEIRSGLLPVYLCTNTDQAERPPTPRSEDDAFYALAADSVWHQIMEAQLPICVVPECVDKGRVVFTADEKGRLASRDWQRGDKIPVCPKHAHDIYRAAGAYGIDQLAEWLRPDAKLDALDEYDIANAWYGGDEIRHQRSRVLRVKIPAPRLGEPTEGDPA